MGRIQQTCIHLKLTQSIYPPHASGTCDILLKIFLGFPRATVVEVTQDTFWLIVFSGSGSIISGMNVFQNEKKLWKFLGKIVGAERDDQEFNVCGAHFLPYNDRFHERKKFNRSSIQRTPQVTTESVVTVFSALMKLLDTAAVRVYSWSQVC